MSSSSVYNHFIFLIIITFKYTVINLYRTIRVSIEVCAAAIFPEFIISLCETGKDTVNVGISF